MKKKLRSNGRKWWERERERFNGGDVLSLPWLFLLLSSLSLAAVAAVTTTTMMMAVLSSCAFRLITALHSNNFLRFVALCHSAMSKDLCIELGSVSSVSLSFNSFLFCARFRFFVFCLLLFTKIHRNYQLTIKN